ncbi:hypothetical protein IMG5_161280 [Ichthyophthirius multifiliis]|uniref:MSP domain-containing protein n=1 Tax=Ichthyophthirius multifiliis TaxID=5932 RepID=G0R020_ICHMU|nr:hypothetical protein IMG5_161280 [Ichthyophthirius multifiliis]EGR29178.1 hypothetical protein IMG5_161280 [Ichthyophthirius multifiliis]|eukprot:XP_004030414.1 hypothetical protein IMG5_161280 [Ichthyophthirius multifiliis]
MRLPGDNLWDFIAKDVEKQDEIQKLQDLIKQNLTNEEEYQKRIDELNTIIPQTKYPQKVSDDKKVNIVFIGHPKCGKTKIAKYLSEIHQRQIINIDECVENSILNKTEFGEQAQKYLEEKKQEYDQIIVEREKWKKKAGKKAPELEAKWGNINTSLFNYLPEEIIEGCIREKLIHPTCNAGVIFDELISKYCSSELMALKCIMKAVGEQELQMVVFQKELDEMGFEIYKMIEWEGMEDVIKEEEEKIKQKLLALELEQEMKKNNKKDEKNKKKDTKQQLTQSIKKKKNIQKIGQDNSQIEEIQENNLFDVFQPYQFQNFEEELAFNKKINTLISLFTNQYKEKIENPPIHDPVFLEGKKEEKKPIKKDAKGKIIPEEISPAQPPEIIDYTELLMKGIRTKTIFPLHYNFQQMQLYAQKIVPQPYYPDPFSVPVQDPEYHQIITKPQRNIQQKRQEIIQNEALKYFQILTPIENPIREINNLQDIVEETLDNQKENNKNTQNKLKRPIASANPRQRGRVSIQELSIEEQEKKMLAEQQKQAQQYQFKKEDLEEKGYRWIIPAGKKLIFVVRFFTKSVGIFDGKLEFENSFGADKYTLDIKAIADYPTISNLSKNIYWQIKKNRPLNSPESYLSKVFVQSENVFDFGPLLIGKNPEKKIDPDIRKINSTTFRISNHGKYEANLTFSLISSIKTDQEYKKGIFFIEPQQMIIQQNDIPQELRVWAIPDAAQKFKDDIIIMIKDNPTPLILPMMCLGCKPIVDIIEGCPIKFERKLLNQQSQKEIKLKNNGQIPVRWRILGIEQLPVEFQLNNTEGLLKPTLEDSIYVTFKAIQQQKFLNQLTLEVEDVENMNIRQENKIIPIEAEAFNISVELKFPDNNQDNMLDFGHIRVGDIKDCYFSVKNIGLYLVQFQFVMKKKIFKESFKIEPQKVELNPEQQTQILVRFCSQSEVRFNTNSSTTDIMMEILEGKTLELFKPVPINVKINSIFSKYAIAPLKSINFGPIQYNDSKTLTLEIKNEGLFEFNYNIFDYFNEAFLKQIKEEQNKEKEARLQAALDIADQKDGKKGKKPEKKAQEKKKKGKNDIPETLLIVNQFQVNPCKGTIPPDSSTIIELKFFGQGQMIHEQKLGIEISGRDPKDQPNGILYELVGESCVPGINCEDFEQIFEEQIIVPSINAAQNITSMINSNVFYLEEKQFFFGTLIPSQNPEGIFEKFKISNPHKIPCSVKFEVRKRNEKSTEPFAFEIAQKQAKIHPHEHTYVKVFFKPTIMAQYSGIFEAIVEFGEQNPKTYKLVFDLKGEGSLPTIKLEKPKEYFNDQTPMLKFPKVRIDKSCILPIIIKNDGKIPATVKWDLISNENFKFLDQNSYTLTPKSYKTFNISFCPKEQGIKQWQIQLQTLLNPYEITKFMIQGEGYYEDIVLEGLPEDLEDEINFSNCIIQEEKKCGFFIKNNKSEHIKFNWNTQGCEDFTFVPRTGHLQAKSSKFITLYFKGNKPTTHKNFALILETKHLKQVGSIEDFQIKNQKDLLNLPPIPFIDWDDSMSRTLLVTQREFDWYVKKSEEANTKRREEEALAALGKKGAKKPAEKKKKGDEPKDDKPPARLQEEEANIEYQEPIEEPMNITIEKTDKNITLKVSGISDYSKYEIQSKEIFFKPTLMYTSRNYIFNVKNISLIPFNYTCTIIKYDEETNQPIIDPGFFYINPKQGTISPSCDEQFTVKFSPTEVFDKNERFLIISIENLDKQLEPLVITLEGETERPICHFELQPTNYRDKKPELDKSFNIIEFESLGTKVKNTKKFYVVNPTAYGYEFEWKKIEEYKLPAGANVQNDNFFKCQTQKGVVLSGKKFEMIFEYAPDSTGNHESYWYFEIPSQKIVQNFLIVGTVNEPNVFFDVGKVNFGPLLIGGKNKELIKIKNLETVPIPFSFYKDSIKGEPEYFDSLQVFPMQGIVNAQSELTIEICFMPKVELQFNYNIQCNVKRKQRPISLNVKGIGYILHHSVYLQQYPNTPLDSEMQHIINLGDMYVNEKRSKIIEIENSGEFNFDFSIKKLLHLPFIQITPENGTVKQNERFQIEVKFSPLTETKLTFKQSFTLNISSGPSYTFRLQANAKKPGVEFSFLSFDFGPQYVFRQPLPITAFLEVKNKDVSAMSIETQNFEKTNYLDVNLPPGQVILPLQVDSFQDKKGILQTKENNILKIPIIFTPRESKKYEETLTFNINGLHTIDVRIFGEGVPLKLELENSQDQNIDFGVVRVKDESSKIVKVSNQSRKPITITFDVEDQLSELAKTYIHVTPSNEFQILPREIKDIEITFHPELRLHQFKKELFYKIVENQEKKKLLNLTALCHGVELKLMEDTIGFGVVVINSIKTKVIQLTNLGDIGTKFEWDFQFCKNYFSISPEKGFLPPHEDIFFTITFHPNLIDNDIHFSKVKCNIEGSNPLYINLLGKCIPQPKEQIQDLKFSTLVRTTTKQKVLVKNPISEQCRIKVSINCNKPNIKGYFTGKEILEIPPNGTSEYEITYNPLTMTANNEIPQIKDIQHEATLFFPLPDGNAILYNLYGQALLPNPLQTFDIVTKAKHSYMQIIPIRNWLKKTQRFSVNWVLDNQDSSIFISGANVIDVPGETTKEYKMNFFCLKQLSTNLTVYFKNTETFEYIHFKINLNIQPADIMEKIEMSAFIRETSIKLITIINPLNIPVQITKEMFTSDNDNITINPTSFKIPPNSEFGFEIIFRPLLVKEEQSKVILNSHELGQSVYQLILKGVPLSTIPRSLTMKTYLGFDTVQSFKFINYCKKQTTYTCRIDRLDFYIEQQQPTIIAPPSDSTDGNELSVNIKYEPSVLGESTAILIINSPEGGEYTCMLHGLSSAPQPKGPFKISGPKPPPIEFKNPFFEPCEFTIRIDNTSFVLNVKNPVKIDAKKNINFAIQYKPVAGNSSNGRLTIQAEKFDYPPWVFYLQGE